MGLYTQMPLVTFVYGWCKIRLNIDAYTTWEWVVSVLDSYLGCGTKIKLKDPETKLVVEFDPVLLLSRYKVSRLK